MDEGCGQLAGPLVDGQRLSGRYRIESAIGRGGVACVMRAYDEREERRVALKCLLAHENPRTHERLSALFHHEYLVLSQLVHPNVVRVYDFGFADGLPYYTMELIDGQPLSALAPLPAEAVVELIRALCEPLSIMHARRWVHRDLSARNAICTSDGRIKLIDFGATVSMDDRHVPMGTPPCMAPEVLHQQPLDARTDVFGLGTLAYFALTGHHAYPSRTMTRLPALWARLPTRPREFAPALSEALEELVMDMINVERSGRPRSTAEVLHRLQGGSRESMPPSTATARASLETPKLVGRAAQLAQLRVLLRTASGGRGGVCAIRGARGMGRTRMLDTLGLEARLAGHAVARVSARQTGVEPLALAKSLGRALLQLFVDEEEPARTVPAGAEWLTADEDFQGEAEHRIAAAQRAFVVWLGELCKAAPVVLLVDDIEVADIESQKLLAQVALVSKKQRLLVAAALGSEAPAPASPLRILIEHGTAMALPALTESEVEDWARSVFGDVHNVARLSRWLYAVSEGRPAACMALAEYLVERGVAVFSAGSFRLPDSFEGLGLPEDMRGVLDAQLSKLGPAAAQFLALLATDIEPRPCDITDYLDTFTSSGGDGIGALSELTGAGVLSATANGYAVNNTGALEWARERLDTGAKGALHRELAAFYQKLERENVPEALLCACYHLWQAGDLAAADALLGDLNRLPSTASTARLARTDGGIALFEALLRHREQRRASPEQVVRLRLILLGLASTTRPELAEYADDTIARLTYDTGLDQWEALPAELPELERTLTCLQTAERRYRETAEAERGVPPMEAVRLLATTAAVLSGVYAIRYEPARCWPLYSLMSRLRALSPVLQLVCDLTEVAAKTLGHGADMRALQHKILTVTREPIGDLAPTVSRAIHAMYSYYLGMVYAAEGNDDALGLVPALEAEPLYAALGLQVRRVHALMTGQYRAAQQYRRERELLALQSEASDQTLHMSLLREMHAAAYCGDVLELTRYVSAIRKRASRFAGWKPWATLGVAHAHFELEEYKEACALLDAELGSMEPFSHGAWEHMATVKAAALAAIGDHAGAAALAQDVLQRGQALDIRLDAEPRLRSVIAIAKVGLGAALEGVAQMQAVLEQAAVSPGCKSVMYGNLCEYRCQIALMMDDEPGFAAHHGQLAELYKNHPALRARYERLQRRARERFDGRLRAAAQGRDEARGVDWAKRLQTVLATQSVDDQAEYLLSILLDEIESESGQLYRVDREGQPRLIACRPKPPDPKLLVQAQRCCQTFSMSERTLTASMPTVIESTLDSHGTLFEPIGLPHPEEPARLQGMLLVPAGAVRLAALTPALRLAISQQLGMLA